MTIKDFCSDVRAMLKVNNSDVSLNDRLIYKEGLSTALLLIKRELNQRRLINTSSIYTKIDCITMEEVPLAECCDYSSEKLISRSKFKIPKIADSLNGLAIQFVTDIETQKKFVQSNPLRYQSILKISPRKSKDYFWIFNDYLYVTTPDLKKISISALFEEEYNLEETPCDCETDGYDCSPVYDKEFKVPGYLIENVKTMVFQKLMQVYYRIPIDRTDNDSNDTSQ